MAVSLATRRENNVAAHHKGRRYDFSTRERERGQRHDFVLQRDICIRVTLPSYNLNPVLISSHQSSISLMVRSLLSVHPHPSQGVCFPCTTPFIFYTTPLELLFFVSWCDGRFQTPLLRPTSLLYSSPLTLLFHFFKIKIGLSHNIKTFCCFIPLEMRSRLRGWGGENHRSRPLIVFRFVWMVLSYE